MKLPASLVMLAILAVLVIGTLVGGPFFWRDLVRSFLAAGSLKP